MRPSVSRAPEEGGVYAFCAWLLICVKVCTNVYPFCEMFSHHPGNEIRSRTEIKYGLSERDQKTVIKIQGERDRWEKREFKRKTDSVRAGGRENCRK